MKKQKGMTLMEIIISMAIYGLLALLAGEIMTSMNMVMKATDQINDRLSYETKFADNVQTKDESGAAFANHGVTYNISYGGTSLGGSKTALEYTMNYKDPRASSSDYVASDVNYRFMTFTKVHTDESTEYEPNFKTIIRFVPYFSDEIPANTATQKVEIQKANTLLSGISRIDVTMLNGELLTTPAEPTMELGTPWIIDVKNTANVRPADATSVSAMMHFDIYRNDWFSTGEEKIYTDSDVELFYFVKVGSATAAPADPSAPAPDLTKSQKNETFYNRCIVEYNVNSGEFKPFKSLTANETDPAYPTLADYNAILNG